MRKAFLLLVPMGFVLAGCHTDMWVQPKARVQGESDFFADGSTTRPKIPGTVARGQNSTDEGYETGYLNGKPIPKIPAKKAMTALDIKTYKEFIERGQDRFNIFCQPCHGMVGDGQGMIAKRGLTVKRPVATFHTDRLRALPDGHFYHVITEGFGVMYPHKSRIPREDRWAIVAYVRALQLSQNADASVNTLSASNSEGQR